MSKKLSYLILFILLICFGLIAFQISQSVKPKLKVYFFDVGQGDAALIDTPNHEQILIDGGPSSIILSRLGQTLPFYDRTIDLVVLTHPHADHVAGLVDVLKRYKVKEIWFTDVSYNAPEYKRFLELIREKNVPTQIAQKGKAEFFGPVKLSTLFPFSSLEGQEAENLNNSSIVNMLEYNGIKILFTGDIETVPEKEMIENKIDIQADYLKQPHHGSKYFLADFLNLVRPKESIISVGKDNNFGHPSPETLKALEDKKIETHRIDLEGTVKYSFP